GVAATAREKERAAVPPPVALAAAAAGFVAFFTTTASPLYRGGHFGFHTQIAEQIWQGRFLLYYLPYPGSMLSRQAQWGDIIVPHPALFHTLVAPLAALPDAWFALAVKLVLAVWLAGIVLVAATLATSAARALAAAGLAAAVVALLLYYMEWTWPFLSQSVPRILHGSGAPEGGGTPVLRRLLALPHKLNYSYGSALIPVLGLAGLARARALRGWPLLGAWAAVLPVFSVADLFFNLLLKHHYFTTV